MSLNSFVVNSYSWAISLRALRVMIALDINVPVWELVQDDCEQAQAARDLNGTLNPERSKFVFSEVILEIVWEFGGSYEFPCDQFATMPEARNFS